MDGLYLVYNRRELIDPDPLMFLYDYGDIADREIAGLVASCLAYGRVAQILKSVKNILSAMGKSPYRFLLRPHTSKATLLELYGGFKHRFTTSDDLAALLSLVSKALREHGSLEALMKSYLPVGGVKNHDGFLKTLGRFSLHLSPDEKSGFSLLPSPQDGSACKRLMLYIKWMTRRDDVDPGGWTVFKPRDLVMPIDTHIHNIASHLGLTARAAADIKAAVEITEAFARISPEDPTRYDFALTRFGIRGALSVNELFDYASEANFSFPPANLALLTTKRAAL
ncbi:TIGR02757 family protein [Synergistales bacterium]|nr:TIGR02757 family protein [Synergistales bacterium]